jgi:cytochrome bd ubiquinol oxidase subunit I
MTPAGVVATLGGWYLAETGRQPWVIYGVLRTADAISPVPAPVLLFSLAAFVCIYGVFMTAFLIFVLRIVRRGPGEAPAAKAIADPPGFGLGFAVPAPTPPPARE